MPSNSRQRRSNPLSETNAMTQSTGQGRLPPKSASFSQRGSQSGSSVNGGTITSSSLRLSHPVRSLVLQPFDTMDGIDELIKRIQSEHHIIQSRYETASAELAALRLTHGEVLRILQERKDRVDVLQDELGKAEQNHQREFASLREVHDKAHQTLQERNNRICSLQNELVETKQSHQEELENLRQVCERALQEKNNRIHSLQNELGESTNNHQEELASLREAHEGVLCMLEERKNQVVALQYELTEVKMSCQKEVVDFRKINERVLDTLEESEDTIAALQIEVNETRKLHEGKLASYQNEINEKIGRIDELHCHLQRSQVRQIEKDKASQALVDEVQSLKEESKHQKQIIRDKDDAIMILTGQLEETKKRDNQNLIQIGIMTSKLSSISVEEGKREKELRDLLSRNESLAKGLKEIQMSMEAQRQKANNEFNDLKAKHEQQLSNLTESVKNYRNNIKTTLCQLKEDMSD